MNTNILIVTRLATLLILSGLFPLHATASEIGKVDPESIHTPNKVKTSIGTLKFIDGAPLPKTAEKVYDYLDTMRGVDAFLKGMPGASVQALMDGPKSIGANKSNQVLIFDELMDSKPTFLTGNTSTLYVVPALDLKIDGPTVLDVPPGMLGSFDVYFGTKAPEGFEGNWLEAIPGKSFFVGLRLYGPLEPWIEKTWRPGEIERTDD